MKIEELITAVSSVQVMSLDTETTGLEWTRDRVFGVSLSHLLEGGIQSGYFDTRERPDLTERLRDAIRTTNARIVNHHIKFDLHMLYNMQVQVPLHLCECTMIRSALIDEHLMSYSLDSLGEKYLGERKVSDIYDKLAALFGGRATRNAQMPNLHRAPVELVRPYAVRDSELALKLWLWQEDEIRRQDLGQVWGLEKRLFPHVFKMERRGIRVDVEKAHQQCDLIKQQIEIRQRELNKIAGFEVNPNPSGSLTKLFEPVQDSNGVWHANDGTRLPSTPGGKPSINAEVLGEMRHPAAQRVVELRKLMRTADTFISGHILGHEHNGRVHPNINQTKGDDTGGTGTGRLSYTSPALQQIPSRDKKVAMIVRPIFQPDEGQGWSYGDLDQHELRIFHHYVNNPKIVKTYRDDPDTDGHQAVANLTGLPRNAPKSGGANAKQMNLGMIFNMGGGELAAKMGLPYTIEIVNFGDGDREFKKPGPEAQDIIDQYYAMVPGVREIAQQARSIAKSRGFVKTLFGRHIRFPGGKFTHKASGLVYQGGAADLNKDNIIRICEYLEAESPESHLLLNIHDEYSISMPFGHSKHLFEIKRMLQDRPNLRIPLRIDFSELCSNWWDATVAPIYTKVD